MAKSGIKHIDVSDELTKAEWESEQSHALVHGNAFPAGPVERQLFYRDDTHRWYIYNGTDWVETTKFTITDADIPATIARDAEVAADIATHADLTTGVHAFNKSCRVYHTVDQTVSHATWFGLAFDSERWDTDSIHDPVTNNSRLTCKTAGVYIICGNVFWEPTATGYRILQIWLNNTTVIGYTRTYPGVAEDFQHFITTIYSLAVNDYVELRARQLSGGDLDIKVGGNYSPEFMMARIA